MSCYGETQACPCQRQIHCRVSCRVSCWLVFSYDVCTDSALRFSFQFLLLTSVFLSSLFLSFTFFFFYICRCSGTAFRVCICDLIAYFCSVVKSNFRCLALMHEHLCSRAAALEQYMYNNVYQTYNTPAVGVRGARSWGWA